MPASHSWRHAADGILRRSGLPLLIALAAAGTAREAAAQGVDIEVAMNGVVQIVATRSGETLRGTGFIVAYDRARAIATILTSSHVISGARFTVRFHADPVAAPVPVPAADVVAIEAENRDGLAVFLVRAAVPAAATVLELAGGNDPAPRVGRDDLQLLGYPSMATTLNVSRRPLSSRNGALYVVDPGVSEGSSGGPVLLNGKVVGLVSNTTAERAEAVPFATIRAFLEGSGVTLAAGRTAATPARPAVTVPGAPTGVRVAGESPAPASPSPGPLAAAARRPAARVTPTSAEFSFPAATAGTFRWYQPTSPPEDTEYSWRVEIEHQDGAFSFELYIFKSKGDRPAEGDFKALLREASVLLHRGQDSYDEKVLSLLPVVSADGLTLRVVGPGLPAVLQALMAARPAEAHFSSVRPGAADQALTVPITYVTPPAAAAPPPAAGAVAREQAFTVVNQAGFRIENLWVAPLALANGLFQPDAAGTRRWPARASALGQNLDERLGPDRLGDVFLDPGDEEWIRFETRATTCDWAFAARPSEERLPDRVWTVNLCAGSHVTLTIENGTPRAIVK